MMLLDKGNKIAIWGTGLYARKLYGFVRKSYDVICFYDNNKERWGQELYGVPIKKWDDQKNIKIIIASSYWQEILEQLVEKGLRLLYDVIPYCFLECKRVEYRVLKRMLRREGDISLLIQELKGSKKVAVIYGNCQCAKLREILLLNKAFSDNYFFIVIPTVCDYNAGDEGKELWNTLLKNDEFWKQIDLFMCQKVNETNRFCRELATDNLVKKLSPTCQVITLINIFFDAYFVQRTENRNNIMEDLHQSGLFPYGDKFVDRLMEKGFSDEEIIKRICNENFITSEYIDQAVSQSLVELKKGKKKWM